MNSLWFRTAVEQGEMMLTLKDSKELISGRAGLQGGVGVTFVRPGEVQDPLGNVFSTVHGSRAGMEPHRAVTYNLS